MGSGCIEFMARKTIEEKKDEIVYDLHAILNLSISEKMKNKVIHLATWAWSQLPGKISKANHWSKLAVTFSAERKNKNLTFEHVVPRSVIAKILLDKKPITPEKIREILEKYCFGCIVTNDEDNRLTQNKLRNKMPSGWIEGDDEWARYKFIKPTIEIQKAPRNFI